MLKLLFLLIVLTSAKSLAQASDTELDDSQVFGHSHPMLQPLPAPVFKALDRYLNQHLPELHEPSDDAHLLKHELLMSLQESSSSESRFLNGIAASPGRGFAASLLVPGLGQLANRQYLKAGIMAAVEVAAIYFIVEGTQRGRRLEREYQQFGDANWSLIKYTAWVHEYYMNFPNGRNADAPPLAPADLLTNAGRAAANPLTGFPDPVYDTGLEWSWVDRNALNLMERRSRYSTGTNFTHEVNPFGSQQYYELMSKYWQFGPGWRDWIYGPLETYPSVPFDINMASNSFMSPMWLQHASMEERFNSAYQLANNMVSALLLNHLISAFDAYFTIKLREHRLESTARADYMGNHVQLTWRF
ncbi:MAG: hypothetical protein JJU41_13270 [Bacteroidetes bacterium]|nr:hypothetical protein [Bacteroidota bacterium]MCH8523339.1 DUF5683 domain-containing protein [Balneolales bacterium]